MRYCFNLFIFCFIAFLNASPIFAQSHRIDSLKKELEESKGRQKKADINFHLSNLLYNFDYEEGIKYAEAGLKIAEEINYQKGKVQALTSIGNYFYYIGDHKTAEEYYQKALKNSNGENFDEYPFKIYIRLSILNRTKSNFDSSWYFLELAKKLLPEGSNNSLHASYYASKGVLANHLSQNREALRYLQKSLQIRLLLKDTVRIADTWRNMGVSYMDISSYDSAEYCFSKAEMLLKKSENHEIRMILLLNKGEMYFAKGAIKQAIESYNLALDKLKSNTFKKYYAKLLYDLGELYSNQNDFNTGYSYLFKSVKEFEDLGDQQNLAKTFSTIGWNYIFQENFIKAKEYGEKSLKIVLAIGDSAGISKSQNLIGFSALKTGDLKIALRYLNSALVIRHKLDLRWGETYTLYNLSLVHIELGQMDIAFDLLYQALELSEKINNKSAFIYINNELGLLYAQKNDYKRAEQYLEKAQSVAKSVPLAAELLTNYENYISLFESKQDSKNSLKYYRLYLSLKDSIDNIISSGRIANADALFQVQQKANELQSKISENLLQKQRIGEQTKLIQLQKNRLIIAGISLFILISLLTVIIRLLILRSKAKEKLRIKNLNIQEQKEEILTQSEELIEANLHLAALNDTLSEKNAEIEAQSELLSDINENLEKQVNKRTKELSAAYKELETFFYKASHDFRRPLTTYLGLVEVAKSTLNDKKALELFDKVMITTLGLDRMITKLQTIGSIDYKHESIEISLSELVSEFKKSNLKTIESKGVKIIVPSETIILHHNYLLFKIIIFNLLENALLFNNPQDPKITIKWSYSNGETNITIEDNGTGIADYIQPRIFEMFFRGNELSNGNGLGLYATKRAVEKLGGVITFKSILNRGSTFNVIIPD